MMMNLKVKLKVSKIEIEFERTQINYCQQITKEKRQALRCDMYSKK